MFREIEILSFLQGHENVLSLYEVMESSEGKDIYIVMEFVQSDLEKVAIFDADY